MKKIGILGGTFNPIHMGHLMLAEHAYEEYHLDYVMVMPSGVSYFKRNLSIPEASIRSELTGIAIKDNSHFVLSEIEVKREGNSYTYETLSQLHEEMKDAKFYYIIGADTLFSIEKWKNVETIFRLCTILVAVRNHSSRKELEEKASAYNRKYNAEICFLEMPNIDISSEKIREMVRKGKSIRYYTPKVVVDYIKEHHLYLEDDRV